MKSATDMFTCCRSISRRAAEGHEAGHGALCRLCVPEHGREPAGRGGMFGDPPPPPPAPPRAPAGRHERFYLPVLFPFPHTC
jgi:hypothetical protein